MAIPTTSEKPARRFASWRLLVLAFVCLGGALLVRWFVLESAVSASLRTMRAVSGTFVKRPAQVEGELFPLWPMERPEERVLEEGTDASPPGSPLADEKTAEKAGPRRSGLGMKQPPPTFGPEPKDARADILMVLGFASRQVMPQGRTVAPEGELPGGIELFGVAPLGLGLLDGDRLITVDGRPVSEQGQVVGAVLAARARRAPAMTAGLARRTSEGVRHFSVVVEQPYPEHILDEAEPLPNTEEEQENPAPASESTPVRAP